jgi:hypothetical protein
VDFYGKRKLGGDALVTACAGLERSDFASLYGATNPYDDFAECFASYVHREMLGQPLLLDVLAGGQPVARLEGFWDSPRSLPKRRFMDCLLGVEEASAPAALAA